MGYFLRHPFDYHACKEEELREFIEERAREDATPQTTKDELVVQLRALDHEAIFSFENMPPELRLYVYEELVFHPEILRVSRLIYKEAKPVLDKQASVSRLVIETSARTGHRDVFHFNNGPMIPLSREASQLSSIVRQLASWPQEILTARFISINVEDIIAAHWIIYQLATIIGNTPVEICIRIHDVVNNSWSRNGVQCIQDRFWSLAHMGPRVQVTLKGFRGDALQDLRQSFAASRSTRTYLYEYLQLIDELQETLDLAKEAGVPAFFVYSLWYSARTAKTSGARSCFNIAEEYSFGTTLRNLKRHMKQTPDYGSIRGKSLSILAARNAKAGVGDMDRETQAGGSSSAGALPLATFTTGTQTTSRLR